MTTTATSDPSPELFTLSHRTVLHLASDLSATALLLNERAWACAADVPHFKDGRVLSVFRYDSTWTWWERHPVGVELVSVLSGTVAFRLDDARSTKAVLGAGQSMLVPEGVWHTAEIVAPASMLFVTPLPGRTEHRAVEIGEMGKVNHG
jgi:mannose-6-phosphate isomerase-like protein (cupin superfamily)